MPLCLLLVRTDLYVKYDDRFENKEVNLIDLVFKTKAYTTLRIPLTRCFPKNAIHSISAFPCRLQFYTMVNYLKLAPQTVSAHIIVRPPSEFEARKQNCTGIG